MDHDDIRDLLAIVAASDKRTVGEPDVLVWHRLIGHTDKDDALEAILEHLRERPGVWLEPGHVAARVRAMVQDRYDRADADQRAAMLPSGIRRDLHGHVDKSAPDDDDYPPEWTPAQRLNAYWNRIAAFRDEQAVAHPLTLLTAAPASREVRAEAISRFRTAVHGREDAHGVNALAVACPFCQASVGEHCMSSPMPGQRQRDRLMAGHPARIAAAAEAVGFGAAQAQTLAHAGVARQALAARSSWDDAARLKPPPPTTTGRVDTSVQRGALLSAQAVAAPADSAQEVPGGYRDEDGRLHFPDSDALDAQFARTQARMLGS